MINAQFKEYGYYLYDSENDIYGQKTLIKDDNGEPAVQGTVRLSLSNTSTTVQQNINYKEASYIALTHNKDINERYVIQYGEQRLKVLYVVPTGRYRQVFLNSL